MKRFGHRQDGPDETSSPRCKNIVVVGGGISGATAARLLTDDGHNVIVLDKGRGAGGRCSTRRNEVMEVDHGAQYFTVTDPRFNRAVQGWSQAGVVARWDARFAEINDGEAVQTDNRERWVGVPTMSRIVSSLLEGVEVKYHACVDKVARDNDGWCVSTDDGAAYENVDDLIVAIPAPQACKLLADALPALVNKISNVAMTPCWAVMAAYNGISDAPFDGAVLRDHGQLSWVARNTSKPHRADDQQEVWVLHADSEWSRKHVDITREQAGQVLMEAFQGLCNQQHVLLPELLQVRAHRWRYARTRSPLGVTCLTHPQLPVVICGDWLLGGKIEAAYLSGLAAAEYTRDSAIST